ncbi:MAG: NosD domain-containing protein [Promethearchaeota archaeon]
MKRKPLNYNSKKKKDYFSNYGFFKSGLCLLFLLLIPNDLPIVSYFIQDNKTPQIYPILRNSNFWIFSSPIFIDDSSANNWASIESELWIRGNGIPSDPYIIENITIIGNNTFSCIDIRNSNVSFVINNCTLINSGTGSYPDNRAGIRLKNTSNGLIINNNCTENYHGIYLYDNCRNNTILENIVCDNYMYGIHLYDSCTNNTISHNYVNSNNNVGIHLYDNCDNNTFSNNTLNNNELVGMGIYDSYYAKLFENKFFNRGLSLGGSIEILRTLKIDTSNKMNENPIYYYVNKKNLGPSNFTDAGQVLLINCSNSIISGLNVSHTYSGILLQASSHNIISGNIANYNEYGIKLNKDCVNNTISENNASHNIWGIDIYENSNSNFISRNNFSYNNRGVTIIGCDYNNFSRNKIIKNSYYGIAIGYSLENTFSQNLIENNTQYGMSLLNADNNTIFKNIFINNGLNAEDNGTFNQWDNRAIGNYWDDYIGSDGNGDGIGESPYIVNGSAVSQDRYPLVETRPIINFSVDQSNIVQGQSIQFKFTGFEGYPETEYYWDFGDGKNSTNPHPIHQYNLPGVYSINLTLRDGNGDLDFELKIDFIYVEFDSVPSFSFTENIVQITLGESVNISYIVNDGNFPLNFSWDFGDGYISYDETPTHRYESPGNYTVILKITDADGDQVNATMYVVVIVPPNPFPLELFYAIITILCILALAGIVFYLRRRNINKNVKTETIQLREQTMENSQIFFESTSNSSHKGNIPEEGVILNGKDTAPEEKEELEKTESELNIQEEEFKCLVHKGIIRRNVYICPYCRAFYCRDCVKALLDKGEKCWACHNDFEL